MNCSFVMYLIVLGVMLIQQQSEKQIPNKISPECVKLQCLGVRFCLSVIFFFFHQKKFGFVFDFVQYFFNRIEHFKSDCENRLGRVASFLRFGLRLFPLRECCVDLVEPLEMLLLGKDVFTITKGTFCFTLLIHVIYF
jgi:hypothetical protein